MGMNIQKSAGIKADTFILKRNNIITWTDGSEWMWLC